MHSKNFRIIKIGAAFGYFLTMSILVTLTVSISLNPWFSFHKNALSDLGSLNVPNNYIFNFGLILTSLAGLVFSFAVIEYFKPSKLYLFPLAMICLSMIGIFPEDYGFPHSVSAVLFYLFSLISIGQAGVFLKKKGDVKIGSFSIIGSIATFLAMIVPRWEGLAIPELIGAGFIVLWILIIATKILKEIEKAKAGS